MPLLLNFYPLCTMDPSHFEGKNSYEHVLEKRAQIATEVHGEEVPGHIGAFIEAGKEMAMALLLLGLLFCFFAIPLNALVLFAIGWFVWKVIKSAWGAWARLERLHRILREEKHEIEKNRDQEQEELKALYALKGFKGRLLDEVVEVLMADDERLLRVMVEEEMGLNLSSFEHPLKQAIGAALGALVCGLVILLGYGFFGFLAGEILSWILMGILAYVTAHLQKNNPISAVIWNLGFASFVFAIVYFCRDWLHF